MPGKLLFICFLILYSFGLSVRAETDIQADFEKIRSLPDNENKVDTLLKLAKNCWYQDPEFCIEIAKYSYSISEQGNYRQKQADALNIIGAGYYFQKQLDSAIHYFNRSLELCYSLDYKEGSARVTNNLGLIHDYLGNYDRAIEYYYMSLEIEQESSNTEGIASTYLNIGTIYVYLEEYDKALEFMTNSLRLYQDDKNEDGILRCFTNIGTIYSDIGIPENALTYSTKALELSRKMKNPDLESANLNNIGEIYVMLDNYPKAIEYFNLALEIEREFDDHWSQANTIRNIGNVYFTQKNYVEANRYFSESLAIAQEIESNLLLKELYHDFYSLFEAQNDFSRALDYHILYTDLRDSLFGEDRRAEINRMESSLKMKYKDQQLEIIRNENEVKNLTIKTQRYALYITVTLVLLILSVVFILVNRARINKKANKRLEENNRLISDQKHLLEATISRLTESEEKYKALTLSIQDGVIIIQDKRLVYLNEAMSALLGYGKEEEVLALKPEQIISAEDWSVVQKNYNDRIAGKDIPKSYTIRLQHKSGKSLEVSIRVKLIQLKGKPAIIGTIKDISKDKAYERQLIREKEKAEKATLSKSLFLAGMSHEIRNHLNGIIGIADVLGETRLNKEQKEYVEVIKNSGDTLSSIINEILDLSRIEAGQISLDKIEFNLRKIIRKAVSLYELKADEKGLKLETEIQSNIPDTLEGDPTRLSQILVNLLGNAVKFTDKGSVKLSVGLQNKDKDDIELRFSVKDTGLGISEESREKLFKPFSQTHAAVERNLGGSGLGLVICKLLVRLMKGKIGVDSLSGKGSDFWFTAKFNVVAPPAKKPNAKRKPSKANNNKILIVEDNVLNQHLTTSILGKEGYDADIAANGQEGVDLFMKKFYNVILMDIQMPVMDGIEATTLIRDYEAHNYDHKSTIIAITAHAKEGDQQRLKAAGLDYFLSKPFQPDALLKIIRDHDKGAAYSN